MRVMSGLQAVCHIPVVSMKDPELLKLSHPY